MTNDQLAAMFSPVLLFTGDQRWKPISVDDYVSGGRRRDWQGRWRRVGSLDQLPTDCPGVVKTPCFTLQHQCGAKKSDLTCANELADAKERAGEKAVYVRVARTRGLAELRSQGLRRRVS